MSEHANTTGVCPDGNRHHVLLLLASGSASKAILRIPKQYQMYAPMARHPHVAPNTVTLPVHYELLHPTSPLALKNTYRYPRRCHTSTAALLTSTKVQSIYKLPTLTNRLFWGRTPLIVKPLSGKVFSYGHHKESSCGTGLVLIWTSASL